MSIEYVKVENDFSEQETRKCRGRIAALICGLALVCVIGFIFIGIPVLTGVCTINTREICNVSTNNIGVSDVTWNEMTYRIRKSFPSNETVCYITQNGVAGKSINLDVADDIIFGRCFVWLLFSILIYGSVTICVVGLLVIYLLGACAKSRMCQHIGDYFC